MRHLSQIFKALSEPTRLEILALLFLHGELCVCDVEEALGVTQSKASRHLRYLLGAGLVGDRREGLWVRYRIQPAPSEDQRIVLDAARRLLTDERAAEVEARYLRWITAKHALTDLATTAEGGAARGARGPAPVTPLATAS